MKDEELAKIQVGDKVILLNGQESIVLAIDCDDDNEIQLACLDKTGDFCLGYDQINGWKKDSHTIIENIENYIGQSYDWYFDFKSCEFKSGKETQPNKCGKCGLIDEYAAFSKKHKEVRCYRCC